MRIFALQAEGSTAFAGGKGMIISRKVFRTAEAAEAYKPEFKGKCIVSVRELDLSYLLDDEHLKVFVRELELVEKAKSNHEAEPSAAMAATPDMHHHEKNQNSPDEASRVKYLRDMFKDGNLALPVEKGKKFSFDFY